MNAVLNYLFLPNEVSPTEKAHVERINRVALVAFYLHIPIFAAVAWICDTGPLFAIVLSGLTLIGPTIAYFTLDSHRSKATVFAFTAMCMGGLLVHFGQGPMQIEMHFYFFVLLALLAVYGNPAVNLVAAVTAAVHHLALWLLLPTSIFNYDASVWVVVVHALFVVLETVAAVFIARSFYDNVIGLEKIVAARTREVDERNRDMRLVLDHVAQGLITIGVDGHFGGERSRMVDAWLGEPPESRRFPDWLRCYDEKAATWLDIGLEELVDDILPSEVIIGQFPQQFRRPSEDPEGRPSTYSLNYQPIHDETGKVEKLLVVISDITEELARAETEAQQRENLRLFELIASDANGFEEFYNEADKMLRRVVDDAELPLRDLKRLVHTLKGNTAIFGLERISRCCHDLEEGIETSGERPERPELEGLDEAWSHIVEKVRQLTGGDRKRQMVVEREDIDALLQGIRDETPYARLERQVQRMHMEPTSKRVAVLAEQAQKIAERLGKTNLRIEQQVRGDVRFEPARWASFWSSLVHVFRNAVDHGLEKSDERADRGKKEEGLIALRTYAESDRFVFEVEDDGRGIDLEALRAKVEARGHEVGSDDDLVQKIFEDGVTTKNVVTETSGRGVGMAAVRAEVEALGGEVAVATRPGEGTRFSFSFPIEEVSPPEATARG